MKKLVLFLSLIISSQITQAQWNAMGSGLTGEVKSLAASQGNLYAGGTFTNPNHVAQWNPLSNSWTTAGDGLNGTVNALVDHNGTLYAGGDFTMTGSGTSAARLAKLNTTTNLWEPVGTGFTAGVKTLFSYNNELYIGGVFNTPVAKIAKLSGSTFVQVGTNPNATVNTIAEFGGKIYIGCSFTTSYLKKLEANTWVAVGGTALSGNVLALAKHGGFLYIGGEFTSPAFRIARTSDGVNISSAVYSLNNSVYTLLSTTTKLLAGGAFTTVPSTGNTPLPYFLSYNGASTFNSEGSLMNGSIFAIANYDNKVVVGGNFSSPGNNVAINANVIGVEELSSIVSERMFFPNPMSDKSHLKVELTQPVKNPTMTIMDANSKIVRKINSELNISTHSLEFVIERESLTAGNYFYVVEDENGVRILSDIFIVD